MLNDLFPRLHARFSSLPLLGHYVEDFVVWLRARGYPDQLIRLRVREMPRVEAGLRRRGVRRLEGLSRAQLLALAPRDSQDDVYLAAMVRSLTLYLDATGRLTSVPPTRSQRLVADYRSYLDHVRGVAATTIAHPLRANELETPALSNLV